MKHFTKFIELCGQTIEVLITIEVGEDDVFDIANFSEGFAQAMARGELFPGYICVTARAFRISGRDSMGACELVSNNSFNSKPFEDSVNRIVEDHGMVDNAVNDLIEKLKGEYDRLIKQAEPFKKFRGAK